LFQNIWAQINQGRIWFSHNWGIGTNDDFSMSFVGDDEQAKIGSAVISSNRTRLYVSRSTGGRGAIYLGATYYNSFEVDGWEYTVTKEEDSPKIDAMESFYAVLRYGSHETSDLLRHSSLTITHEELKTRHIFAPIKTITVETAANLPILASKSGYVFTKARGLGTKYDISYYRLNVGNPIFTEFLEEESTHAYGNTNVSLEDQDALRRTLQHFGATADDFSEEILLERVYSIKESYGEAPTLTPGVASYFEEVVSGAKTTLEALRLLEQELGTYTYTTAPGKIPDGEDFLEYFLLESKQGYCTYFASAFVLLARHIGLPARFVQGFCVPNVASDNGMYEVTSRMAHAWPEVYFEGVGWIAFEPTPGFYVYRNQRWEVLIQEEKVDLGQPIAPLPIATEPEEPSDETSEEAVEEEPQDVRVPIERILLLFLGLVLTAVLIYSFDVIVSRRRYRRYNLSQKILYQTERILRLLECFGQSPKPSDTIHEICAWLEQSTLPKETIDFLKVYESIRYGNQAENEQDLEKATLAVTLLLHELKLQHRMSYYRFVLLHTSSRNYVLQKGKE
jgi:transglutaminase-like putative cysteine protease